MIIAKLEISLHDNSLIHVTKTDGGAIYVELLQPMNLKDGHGLAVKGSALLSEETLSALVALLTSGGGNSVARDVTVGPAGDEHQPASINS